MLYAQGSMKELTWTMWKPTVQIILIVLICSLISFSAVCKLHISEKI